MWLRRTMKPDQTSISASGNKPTQSNIWVGISELMPTTNHFPMDESSASIEPRLLVLEKEAQNLNVDDHSSPFIVADISSFADITTPGLSDEDFLEISAQRRLN
jgi:hypothetical protein